ncbi:PREDICTED: ICOS ligand-like [Poecilia mexicana]|uniref:ICOS ligand-like n=1 Tax=Poecilia mexicana TaxID=48701 RepID=UPI00072EC376|nr:PREDICTED: ICOS ligand-like [Poecilia mexicana]
MAFMFTALLLLHLMIYDADQSNVKAKPGDTVTLKCSEPDNKPVLAVEWSRGDLAEEYVLLFRDKQIDPTLQHPSYRNRVDLEDRQMTNGNIDLILKNVTADDKGRYECRVFHRRNRRERAVLDGDPVSVINLDVHPPDPHFQPQTELRTSDGNKLKSVPLTVFGVSLCFIFGLFK